MEGGAHLPYYLLSKRQECSEERIWGVGLGAQFGASVISLICGTFFNEFLGFYNRDGFIYGGGLNPENPLNTPMLEGVFFFLWFSPPRHATPLAVEPLL